MNARTLGIILTGMLALSACTAPESSLGEMTAPAVPNGPLARLAPLVKPL